MERLFYRNKNPNSNLNRISPYANKSVGSNNLIRPNCRNEGITFMAVSSRALVTMCVYILIQGKSGTRP